MDKMVKFKTAELYGCLQFFYVNSRNTNFYMQKNKKINLHMNRGNEMV